MGAHVVLCAVETMAYSSFFPDKFKTVHSETEAVSFKRPRIERTLKEYSSLLKDLCENTPDLEVIEIIPSVQ